MQHAQSGQTRRQGIPSILADVAKIRLAKQQGDQARVDIAKRQYDAKIAMLHGKMLEKHYNDKDAARQKLSELEIAFDKLTQDQTTERTRIETIGKSDVQTKKNKGLRDVQTLKDKGEQERLDDVQEWEQGAENRRLDNVMMIQGKLKGKVPQATLDAITNRVWQLPEPPTEAVLYRMIMDDPDLSREEKIQAVMAIVSKGQSARPKSGGSTTADRSNFLEMTERGIATDTLINDAIAGLPILTQDVKEGFWGSGSDPVGTLPNTIEYYEAATSLAQTAAATPALKPSDLLVRLGAEVDKSRKVIQNWYATERLHDREGQAGTPGDPLMYAKKDPSYRVNTDKTPVFATWQQAQHAWRVINFLRSEQGKQLVDYLRASGQAEGYLDYNEYIKLPPSSLEGTTPTQEGGQQQGTTPTQEGAQQGTTPTQEGAQQNGGGQTTTPPTKAPVEIIDRLRPKGVPAQSKIQGQDRTQVDVERLRKKAGPKAIKGMRLVYEGPQTDYLMPGDTFESNGIGHGDIRDGVKKTGLLLRFLKPNFTQRKGASTRGDTTWERRFREGLLNRTEIVIPEAQWHHFKVVQ